ncbi:MAG: DUF3696 domain-containing protein [Epsilonproteobacteria bacterium]|nr:MAG: DUF3696 domain-containing protein [Campylobacterota bacterium]
MKLNRVKVKNFKSLRDIDLTLSDLTLLTGVNSSGKSSFIQSILLLRQNINGLKQVTNYNMIEKLNIEDEEVLKYIASTKENISLLLDGEYVSLGNYKNILYQEIFNENMNIEIYSENKHLKISYDSKLNTAIDASDYFDYQSFNLFLNNFQYIMTDRISPAITYPLSDTHIKDNLIGLKGEYTAHFLAENKNKNIFFKELKHPNSVTNQLLENVSLWLNEISSGIDISSTINYQQNNVALTYSYKYKDSRTNEFNPLNVGFGITYVLPIIVAILKAKPNDLLIIENPESHLHPAGQSKIAELCAIASSCGVQMIVETHSDHFLNGITVATKKQILKPDNSQVYYFRKEKDKLETKIDKINIDKNGNINEWPEGFFDEWDNQLDSLLGL